MENVKPEKPVRRYSKLIWACALGGGILPGSAVAALMMLTWPEQDNPDTAAVAVFTGLAASALYGLLPSLLTAFSAVLLRLTHGLGGVAAMTVIGGLVSAAYAGLTPEFGKMLFGMPDVLAVAFSGVFSAFILSVFLPDEDKAV